MPLMAPETPGTLKVQLAASIELIERELAETKNWGRAIFHVTDAKQKGRPVP
jgi:hypothetical protein